MIKMERKRKMKDAEEEGQKKAGKDGTRKDDKVEGREKETMKQAKIE